MRTDISRRKFIKGTVFSIFLSSGCSSNPGTRPRRELTFLNYTDGTISAKISIKSESSSIFDESISIQARKAKGDTVKGTPSSIVVNYNSERFEFDYAPRVQCPSGTTTSIILSFFGEGVELSHSCTTVE